MVSIRRMIFPGLLPSPLKVRYYRWITGAKIGKGTKISFFSYIKSPVVIIGDNCRLGLLTFVEAVKEVRMGKNVHISIQTNIRTGTFHIDDDSEIMDNVRIGGILTHKSKIIIGKRVGIFPFAYINPSYEIILEDGVGIGGRSHLFTHGSWPSKIDGFPMKFAPITIRKNVWLGWRVTILPGVEIGENSIIQADTLVVKSIPANSIAAGNPAQISKLYIFKYTDKQKIKLLKEIYTDFRLYLEYIGYQVEIFPESNYIFGFEILQKRKICGIIVFWCTDSAENISTWFEEHSFKPEKLVVIFFRMNAFEQLPLQLKTKRYVYFIINTKSIYGYNAWVDEVRSFFQRYGITFEKK